MNNPWMFRVAMPLALFTTMMGAQMTVPMPTSPHAHVHIKRLSDTSVSVTNEDLRDIIAICALWTIVDKGGKSTTTPQISDGFSSTLHRIIIPANGTMVLGSQGWMAALLTPGSMGNGAGTGPPAMADRIKQVQSITLSIDSIIFADGEVWGPNVEGLDEKIVQRWQAAAEISKVARQTIASGGDLKAALTAVRDTPYSESDFRGKCLHTDAQMLLMQPDPQRTERMVEYFEALPEPIAFTARQ